MRTILTNATLIDCVNPAPIPNASVVIEDGRITQILAAGQQPPAVDAVSIDLNGAYLLPGLWDVHIHPDYFPSPADMPIADQVTLFGHKMTAALAESGIVGMRCAGAHHYMDVAWKRAYESGQHVGPRLRDDEDAAAEGVELLRARRHLAEVGAARHSGQVPEEHEEQLVGGEERRQRDGVTGRQEQRKQEGHGVSLEETRLTTETQRHREEKIGLEHSPLLLLCVSVSLW